MSEKQAQDILFTPEDVAKRLRVSPLTVGNWLRSGKLKGLKVGRLWRVRESDLKNFLKGGEHD
jgi:excisionase family DNA binding protein